MAKSGRATRDDVARLAGTSSAVVSYVVNNGPRPVSEATRRRVLAAIDELGYEPNRLAQALRANRSTLLGLVLPELAIPFFAELRQALERAAFARGRLLLVGYSSLDETREREYAEVFSGLRVEALIVIAASPSTERARTSLNVPVLYLHRVPARRAGLAVAVDNEQVGYLATRHLLEHGHQNVWCLGSEEPGPLRERMTGWRRAMLEKGRHQTGRLLRTAEADRGAAQRVMREWLAEDRPPRAVFAVSDEHAIGAISAAQAEGRTVPGGLAVIGADGIRESGYTVPPLATVQLPIDAMAQAAIDLVLRENPAREETKDLTDLISLVPRASCGCRPGPTEVA